MPATDVFFYREDPESAPALDWLRELYRSNQKAFANCVAKVRLLRAFGYELRRPHVDYLRDGIYELCAKERTVQYRILFFYSGKNVVILAHALTKEGSLPRADIDRAVERKKRYEKDPNRHRAVEEVRQGANDL